MYGKVFESMWTGSMMGVGAHKQSVWVYALAHTRKGSVELNPDLIAKQIGMSIAQATKAIEYLCSPDPESRSKEEDGKRLLKTGQYLYEVVNWNHYRSLHSEDERREYERIRKRNYRAKTKMSGTVPDMSGTNGDCPGMSLMSRNAEADADANPLRTATSSSEKKDIRTTSFLTPSAEKKKGILDSRPESKEQCVEHCVRNLGLTENDGKALWEHWCGNGFRNNGRPMTSWRHTASNWRRRNIFFPSLQPRKA